MLLYNNISATASSFVFFNNSFSVGIPNLIWSPNSVLKFLDVADRTSLILQGNEGS